MAGLTEFKVEPGAALLLSNRLEFGSSCARDVTEKNQRQMQVVGADQAPAAVLMHGLRERVQLLAHCNVGPERKKQPAGGRIARQSVTFATSAGNGAINATASAAIPSPRPAKPSFSVVLALTLTSRSSTPRSAAMLTIIAAM